VTCAGDVVELFGLEPAAEQRAALGAAAAALLDRLREGALTAEELVLTSGLDAAQASAALVELELARLVAIEDGVYRAAV
jgi:predicted Rossmann fold nucleotide-binding protein DprA/Smf involved in DNA uptake